MHLITMAHFGEAQGVIEMFNLTKSASDLYEGPEISLLLTGEGPFEAATKTALILGQKAFKKVINLGIAGSLKEDLTIGDIHPVRTHYLVIEGKPQFKTFQGFNEGLDCITSFERVLTQEKSEPLKGLGALIDREAWGVAQAAKIAGIPFLSFKLISDQAGTLGACEAVKEAALEWSQKLALHLKTFLKLIPTSEEKVELHGFHFTFTTRHQFLNLLDKLSIKEEKSSSDIISSLQVDQIKEEVTLQKERTKKLIHLMEIRLDPVKETITNKLEQWQKIYSKHGIHLSTDPNWEEKTVKVSFEIQNDEEIKNKIAILHSLSLKPYHQILDGNFHVE